MDELAYCSKAYIRLVLFATNRTHGDCLYTYFL